MSFSLDVSKMVSNVENGMLKTMRGTLLGVSGRTIKRTPVGNPEIWLYFDKSKNTYVDYISALGYPRGYVGGRLRAAWQATINTELVGPAPQLIDSNGGKTISKVSKILGQMKIGDTFRLTNPLPYAYSIEFGGSDQAPQGMLRLSIAETQQVLNAL